MQALDPNRSHSLQVIWQSEQTPDEDSNVPDSQTSTHLLSGVSLYPSWHMLQSNSPGPLHSLHEAWQSIQGWTTSLGKVPLGQGGPQELSDLIFSPAWQIKHWVAPPEKQSLQVL